MQDGQAHVGADTARDGKQRSDQDSSSRAPTPGDPYRGPGGEDNKKQPTGRSRRSTLFNVAGAVIIIAAGLIGYGYYAHSQQSALAEHNVQRRQSEVPVVRVEKLEAQQTPREIHLPSNTLPFDAATLYARQSGYISKRLVDIGDRVKAGQLLVTISAPEVDDQLNQARAQLVQMQAALEQSQANRSLAQVTNNHFTPLVQQGWETKQTGDQNKFTLAAQNAAVDVAKANIQAQQAQIARLARQQSYEQVIAPFNGVITLRNIDIGSLVTADTTSGTPLFAIANTDVLRVQVYVPQDAALEIKPGLEASLEVPELQGRMFKGRVTRTASSLDPTSRTLLVEVDIDNKDQVLTSGLYGIVHFQIPRLKPVFVVPSQAIIFNQNGMQVAVTKDGKANLRKITIAEDDGATLQISEGLNAGDEIILNPPAGIGENAPVKIAPPLQNNKPQPATQ